MIKISISGPRGAGKTVLAKAISASLTATNVQNRRGNGSERNNDVDVISIDPLFDPVLFCFSKRNSLPDVVHLIREWAEARNLITGSTPQAQTVKLFEEGGEVAGGVARKDTDKIKDSIGDVVVVLVILAAQTGLDFADCVASAYDEIKDRRGRMVDGVYIKEA